MATSNVYYAYVDEIVGEVVRVLNPAPDAAEWDGRQSSVSPAPASSIQRGARLSDTSARYSGCVRRRAGSGSESEEGPESDLSDEHMAGLYKY